MSAPDIVVRLSGDMYRMHRRPGYTHIVINDDYQGVKIIDPLNNLLIGQQAFPDQYSPAGIIDNWFFSADGSRMITVCEEDRRVALIDLVSEQGSAAVEYPPIERMSNLAYIWDDAFFFFNLPTRQYFLLQKQDNVWGFAEQRSIDMRIKYPRWCAVLDHLPAQGCAIQRIEPALGTILYHDYRSKPQQIGLVSWREGQNWSIPINRQAARFCSDGNKMFLLDEQEVEIFDRDGTSLLKIESPSGFHFWDVDALRRDETHATALVILSASLQEDLGQLLVYMLP
jgi:hypothetical protein